MKAAAPERPSPTTTLSELPEVLASFYRTRALEDGYFYDPARAAWVKDRRDTQIAGDYDATLYASAGEAAWDGLEPEIQAVLEAVEQSLESILATERHESDQGETRH